MSADDRKSRGQGPDPRRGGGRGRPKSGGGNRPQSDRRRRPDSRPQKQQEQQKQPRPDARTVALAVMAAVRERAAYANLALPAELRRAKLDTRDAALATELTYGTLRAQGLLDRVIVLAASRPVEEIDPPVLDLVRLGAYQLLLTRIGAHAAVDTAVEAARTAGLGLSLIHISEPTRPY